MNLSNFGLYRDTPSFRDVQDGEKKPKRKFMAICTSDDCNKTAGDNRMRLAIKNVSRSISDCPDCDHALVWQDELTVKITLNASRTKH